jgi:hypothetical protein
MHNKLFFGFLTCTAVFVFGIMLFAGCGQVASGGGGGSSIASPSFVLSAGSYEVNSLTVTIETTVEGAAIYYTTDGSTPTRSSTLYATAISLEVSATVKAIAVTGDATSAVVSAAYDLYWWQALGSGMSDFVNALAVDSAGNLYAGGEFTTAGGISSNYVAKWDGTAWHNTGRSDLVAGGSYVSALAIDTNNNYLYSRGVRDSVASYQIAKWNGTNWVTLEGFYGTDSITIYALAVDGSGNLFAGGDPSTVGSLIINHIARWDGAAWSALDSGVSSQVNAIAIDNLDQVYVGGTFTQASGITVNYIAKWDGSDWSALDVGANEWVMHLVCDNSDRVYAAGYFTSIGGISASHIAMWDGSWHALGEGISVTSPMAVDGAGNLYVGNGSASYVKKWNGASWTQLPGAFAAYSVDCLVFDSNGNLYAGGSFTQAGGVSANYIAKWGRK